MSFSHLYILVLPTYLIYGAFYDFLTLKLSNYYNLIGFMLFAPFALLIGLPIDDILMHFFVSFAVLIIGIGAFGAGFFGGGDAKFLAVSALWLGYESLPLFILYTAVAGGGIAIFILIGGRLIPQAMQPSFFQIMVKRKMVPYGTAMALAVLCVYRDTWIWTALMS